MTVRRIASIVGATVGAVAMALAPTAAHAAFNHIEIGGVTAPAGGTSFTGTGKAPITATIPGFGTITCSSASAGGTVRPADLRVTSLSLACPTIIPGSTATIAVNSTGSVCTNGVVFTPDAAQTLTRMGSATNPPGYALPYDTAVTGTANFGVSGNKCISVTFKVGSLTVCSFGLYGNVPWTFNETPKGTKPAISQQLNLAGTLTITDLSGACPGLSNGLTVTLSVPLNITTPIVSPATNPGLIDFVP